MQYAIGDMTALHYSHRMEHERRVGVLLISTTAPERLPVLAGRAETLGFDEVWLAEDYFFYGGFAGVSGALAGTERIKVGLGVASCMARHPAVTAMEIASVEREFPGRFMPGIGHGVPAWVKQMGLFPRSPLRALEEAFTGSARFSPARSRTPPKASTSPSGTSACPIVRPPRCPLYLGVIGQKGCEMAGRIADGNVLSVLAPAEYVSWAGSLGRQGMKAAGRAGRFGLPAYVLTAVGRDRASARAAVRESLAFYLAALGPTPLTAAIGVNDMLAELLAGGGGAEALLDSMPEEWVDTLAIAGTPDEVAVRIAQYWAAGADS